VGHFAGIISALVLKKTGVHYLLLPRQSWIQDFESETKSSIEKIDFHFTYYEGSDNLNEFEDTWASKLLGVIKGKLKMRPSVIQQFEVESSQEISQLRLNNLQNHIRS